MAKASGLADSTAALLTEGLPNLSRSARDFVRLRPRDARLAVAVALETAAAQFEAEDRDASDDVPEQLRPFALRRRGGDVVGVSEAAARLEVSRTTIYEWTAKGTLIAWKSTRRGLSIPAAQILGPGKVVPGLADVVGIIGDPELAWAFLSQDWPFEDTAAAPFELLTGGRIGDVLDAARGFGATFT